MRGSGFGVRTGVRGSGCGVRGSGFRVCSGSEADSYLRLIDFVYHSTLGLRVIKKKKKGGTKRVFRAQMLALVELSWVHR